MHNVADTELNATLSGKPHESQLDNIKKQKLSLSVLFCEVQILISRYIFNDDVQQKITLTTFIFHTIQVLKTKIYVK